MMELNCLVRTKDQADAAIRSRADTVTLEWPVFPSNLWNDTKKQTKEAGKTLFLALPAVFRSFVREKFAAALPAVKAVNFDGFLVRSLEEIAFLREHGIRGTVVSDSTIPVWNRSAKRYLHENGVARVTASLESSYGDLCEIGFSGEEIVVYGAIPMMFTENCLYKTTSGCDKKRTDGVLIDRMNHRMTVVRDCTLCLNTIYNAVPLSLLRDRKKIETLDPAFVRVSFTTEDRETSEKVLAAFERAFLDREEDVKEEDGFLYTRGRFRG